jgi:Sigma-70, region 4
MSSQSFNIQHVQKEIKHLTCFDCVRASEIPCERSSCRDWIDDEKSFNCSVICSIKFGPQKLEEIADLFKVTRMRICQIEHKAKQKMKDRARSVHN